MSEIDFSLLGDFLIEATEHLEEMEARLLQLQVGGDNRAIYGEIFRPIHTIKGAAQFVGLDKIAVLSHRLEDLLDLLRNGERPTTPAVIEVLIEGRDRIQRLVQELEQWQIEKTDVDDLVQLLSLLLAQGAEAGDGELASLPGMEAEEEFFPPPDIWDELQGMDVGQDGEEFVPPDFVTAGLSAADETPGSETAGMEPGMETGPLDLNDLVTVIQDELRADAEFDPELYKIFLEQLRSKLQLVAMLTRALQGTQGRNQTDILAECENHIGRLRIAANYMSYEALVALYDDWLKAMKAARAGPVAAQALDVDFMERYLEALAQIFPDLSLWQALATEVEERASELEEPAGGEVDHLDQNEVQGFIIEALDHLDTMESALLQMREDPDNRELLDKVFRAVHTIKGVAHFVGLTRIAALTHRMEDLLSTLRRDAASCTPERLSLMIEGKDRLVDLVEDLQHRGQEESLIEDLLERFENAPPSPMTAASLAKPIPVYAEDHDKELLDIFLKQFEDITGRLREEAARYKAGNEVGAVQRVLQGLRRLEYSAGYMGYEELQGFYQNWIKQIQQIERALGTGAGPRDIDFIEDYIRQLRASFPDLATATAEAVTPAAPIPPASLAQAAVMAEPESAAPSLDQAASVAPPRGEEALMARLTEALMASTQVQARTEYETLHGVFEEMLSTSSAPPVVKAVEPPMASAEPITPSATKKVALSEAPPAAKLAATPTSAAIAATPLATKKTSAPEVPSTATAVGAPVSPVPAVMPASQVSPAAKAPALSPGMSPASKTVEEKAATSAAPAAKAPVATSTQDTLPGGKPVEAGSEEKPEAIASDRAYKKSVRVDADKIDVLMNQVGELIVDRSYFYQLHNEIHELHRYLKDRLDIDGRELKPVRTFAYRLGEAISALSRTANELQESVMKVRMLPISQLFNRYPRLIHDLTNHTDKKVKLVVRGEETELDKMIVEELSDPLIHILRNAVDHGFETVEERKRLGKPEEGTLIVEAYQESNHIVIEVTDDGRGIDIDRVKAKALERKLYSKDELDRLSQRDLMRLIMTAGFSTADKVSRTSGRGVGMDVVRKNIEKLNGTVEVESKVGVQTHIRLKIPLTLAIIPALLVRVGNESFTIPLSNVEETLRVYDKDTTTIEGAVVIHLRGHTMPIFRLSNLFNIPSKKGVEEKSFVVVVNAGSEKVGLVVDELMGQDEVVIKPLVDYLQEKSGFSGATIIGDGRISLILDVFELVKMAGAKQANRLHYLEEKRRVALNGEAPKAVVAG